MVTATTSQAAVDMSKGWMRDNPELAGKALLDFFEEYPPDEWKLTISRAFMPGIYLTLRAVRRE